MGFYLTTSLSVAGIIAVQNSLRSLVLYDIHTLPCLRGKVVANLSDLSLCATEVAFSTPFASLPRLSYLQPDLTDALQYAIFNCLNFVVTPVVLMYRGIAHIIIP
jgi:hypothetical protein